MKKLTLKELLEMKTFIEKELREIERQKLMLELSVQIIDKYMKMKEAEERERCKEAPERSN
ncbi:MAG: hypothetical protein QXO15_05220 [Nitrososphaerota archaeon]